jgi:23S rRNA pseudouridine1911/1915/1917 synthase
MGHDSERTFFYEVPEGMPQVRLDLFLFAQSVGLSRSKIQALIKNGDVRINDCCSKPSHRLKAGDRVSLSIPSLPTRVLEPEAVEFGIIHEDESIIIVNKPPGLVVHPAPGHFKGTLVHGLLQHCRDLSTIGGELRPGVVHRLDKDTSGVMVVAKGDRAHRQLTRQFRLGKVKKEYIALVHGKIKGEKGEIDLSIARHPRKRKEMSVTHTGGRRAITIWGKIEEFQSGFSLLKISLRTGRTHQIRVHLSHIGHPVAGDPVYGYGRKSLKKTSLFKKGPLPPIDRQMLHSRLLGITHPDKGAYMEFEAPLAVDMERVLNDLRMADLKAGATKGLTLREKGLY